jgi:hypothetical protein
MLLAIDLDYKLPVETKEVDRVGQNRNLPLELESVQATAPQRLPQHVLGSRRHLA